MSRSRPASPLTVAALTVALAVVPVLLAGQPAQATNTPGGHAGGSHQGHGSTKDSRSKSTSPTRRSSSREEQRSRTAQEQLDAGELGDEYDVHTHALLDANPTIKALPRTLVDKTEVIHELITGGKDSTATLGALKLVQADAGGYAWQPRVLEVKNDGEKVTVTVEDEQRETFTFHPHQGGLPEGWNAISAQLRARTQLKTVDELTLLYMNPQALREGHFPPAFPESVTKEAKILARDRQLDSDTEGALNALSTKDLSKEGLEGTFPGQRFTPTAPEALDKALATRPDGRQGIIRTDQPINPFGQGDGPIYYTVYTLHGQTYLFDIHGGWTWEAKEVAKALKQPTLEFLDTTKVAPVIPARTIRRLADLPVGKFMPTTHAEAFAEARHLKPGEDIEIDGGLTNPSQAGDPYPQGVSAHWKITRNDDGQTYRVWVMVSGPSWHEEDHEAMTFAELQKHARAHPTTTTTLYNLKKLDPATGKLVRGRNW
jgi:hypothetical protein